MKLLDGLRIIDTTHVLAGPFCTYQMALLGADVIRIDSPYSRDIARYNDPDETRQTNGLGTIFLGQNANKRSIVLDLKVPTGRQIYKRLVRSADVVVENFRPGVMERLGLGSHELRADQPELIYCSLTGFGQDGPFRDLPAYDHIIQGISGIMSITGTDESGPIRVGFPIVDYVVGLVGAYAITAALVQRGISGQGCVLDVAMLDAALTIMGPVVSALLNGGIQPSRIGNKPYSGSPFSGVFETLTGLLILVCNTIPQTKGLLQVVGREDIFEDPRVSNWQAYPELFNEMEAIFAPIFATRPAEVWEALLAEAGVPAGKVRSLDEVLHHPHITHRDFLHEVDVPALGSAVQVPGVGFKVDGQGGGWVSSAPPTPGEHTESILQELDYPAEEIAALFANSTVR